MGGTSGTTPGRLGGRFWRRPPYGPAGNSPAEAAPLGACTQGTRRHSRPGHRAANDPAPSPGPVRHDAGASALPSRSVAEDGLIEGVRAALRVVADPAKAEPMRAYMRSAMPFLGVSMPERTRALRPVLAAHPIADPDSWRGTVGTLWREATYREERYAALAIAHRYPAHLVADPPASLQLLDELVVTGAWWDLVDDVAIRLVGPLLLAAPAVVAPAVRRWARDADRWRRRAAVICQIGAKDRVDTALLTAVIEANLADPDFFLRKGIGWALRQHARVDPDWVRTFAATHALSPLSRREALKHLRAEPPPAAR